jgi:hypothetical protein
MGFYLSDNEAGVAFISLKRFLFNHFLKYWGERSKKGASIL